MATAAGHDTFYMEVDSRGRPTIPLEQRRKLGLEEGGTLAGTIIGDTLVVKVPDNPFDKLAVQAQEELDNDEGTILVDPEE